MDTDIDKVLATACGSLSAKKTREGIISLENVLKEMVQIDIPVTHKHSGGVYCRQITIPAGVMLTGRIYKDDHIDVMISGSIIVTNEGDEPKRLEGFNVFESFRGKKRAGYAITDTVWLTFHNCPIMAEGDYTNFITFETFDEYDSFLLESPYIEESIIKDAFESQENYFEDEYESFKKGYIAGRVS